ncbi:FCS-Like zinc finger 13 [Tanacetum coccineum]
MVMRGAVIEKLFASGAGWFEGSSSCSSPTSPLDLKLVMSPRRVLHNSSCDEVVSGRGIGLGIIVNMDKSCESKAILVQPSHHVNANIDDEEEYTIVTLHHKPNNNNSYRRKELVYDICGDEKLIRGEKAFCSIECRSMEIAKMEEEEEGSMKRRMKRNKHDCRSSTSTNQ